MGDQLSEEEMVMREAPLGSWSGPAEGDGGMEAWSRAVPVETEREMGREILRE